MTRFLIIFSILLPSMLYGFCFEEAAKEYGIPRQLLESIAETESRMNPLALNINTNGSLDMGLMQINSFWVHVLGLDKDRLVADSCYNVKTGARVLRQCIDRYGYNWEAVGCYNAMGLQKKIGYSWKIFRSLNARKNGSGEASEERTPAPSSLLFEVIDSHRLMPVTPNPPRPASGPEEQTTNQ